MLLSEVARPTPVLRLDIDGHALRISGSPAGWLSVSLLASWGQEPIGLVRVDAGHYCLSRDGYPEPPVPGDLHAACRELLRRREEERPPEVPDLAEGVQFLVATLVVLACIYALHVLGGGGAVSTTARPAPGFGQRLTQARLRLRYTQDGLGQLVGCSGSSICALENDRLFPSAALFLRLQEALGVTSEALWHGAPRKLLSHAANRVATEVLL